MSDNTELAKHVLHTVYDAQSIVGKGYLSLPEVATLVSAETGKVEAALAELLKAGLIEENEDHEFRARGTVATPGPEEKAVAYHPEAAAQTAMHIRREALAHAVGHNSEGGTAADITRDAATFEAYLAEGQPKPSGITKAQVIQIESALEDAEQTLSMIDAPETLDAIRTALATLNTIATA